MQNDAVVPVRSAAPAGARGGPKAAWLPGWPQGDWPDVTRGMLRRAWPGKLLRVQLRLDELGGHRLGSSGAQ